MKQARPARCLMLAASAAISASATCLAGGPVNLPVQNHSFEANPVPAGCFAVFMPSGWNLYDPFNLIDQSLDAVGGLHPEGGPYFPDAPDGQNMALIFLSGDVGAGPVGLSQTLTATLEADTLYTLSVYVGDIASGQGPPPCDVFGFFNLDGFPGYRIELRAGGEVLVADDNSLAAVLSDGEYALSTIATSVPPGHPQLGQPLEILLINLNQPGTPEQPGIEVDFDLVVLTAEPVSTPTCAGDLDADGDVDSDDLGVMLGEFGCVAACAADLDGDGDVDSDDLGTLLGAFGLTCD